MVTSEKVMYHHCAFEIVKKQIETTNCRRKVPDHKHTHIRGVKS